MRRGTVVRVRLNPVLGSEQGGERPAIVISPTFMNERSSVVLVAPITSKKMERIYPFEARIDHSACGLSLPSKAMLNQIRTIDKERLSGEYGVADDETMAMVDAAIRIATGLVPI
jgi:mRNA interferase MazF